ncbi:MAG: hypothetical protein WC444_06625 [Candidatus Paceibacterota bacterium]
MTNETISTTVEGKEVIYDVRNKSWTYDGVAEAIVVKLTPSLASTVNKALEKNVAEYQARILEEAATKKAAELAKMQEQLDTFKRRVTQAFTYVGYTLKFADLTNVWARVNEVSVSKDNISAEVRYDSSVYHSGSFGSSLTNKPWIVSFSYKNIRYTTLEKALEAAKTRIDEKIAENTAKVEAKKKEEDRDVETQEKLDQYGIKLVTEVEYGRNRSYNCKRAVITVAEDNDQKYGVALKGSFGMTDLEVEHVKIRGRFSAEQFQKLAEFVKTLDVTPVYDY